MKYPHLNSGFLIPRLWITVLLACCVFPAAAESYSIDQAAWQQPRSAVMVKSLPAVKAAVQELLGQPGARLSILHEADEEGALWGAELRDWLVSLGVPPGNMMLGTAEVAPAALRLDVQTSGRR